MVAYAYFKVCSTIQPRLNLITHPQAERYLIGLPDAGKHLYTHHVIILTQVTNNKGKVESAAYELIALKMYVNKLNYTMPENELLALNTCLFDLWQIRKFLQEQNYHFKDNNVIACSDSTTSLIQVRTTAIAYNIRVGSLSNKAKMIMAENNMDPFKNLFWFDQSITRYPPDLTSKLDLDTLTTAKLDILQQDVEVYPEDLIMTPPHEWKSCCYDIAIPSYDNLGLKDDYNVIFGADIIAAGTPTIHIFKDYERGQIPTLIKDEDVDCWCSSCNYVCSKDDIIIIFESQIVITLYSNIITA